MNDLSQDMPEKPSPEVTRAIEVRRIPDDVGAPIELPPPNPLDLPTDLFRAALARRKANREALMEWIASALVKGVDVGQIHTWKKTSCSLGGAPAPNNTDGRCTPEAKPLHWSKPSLWKPGAEKITGMLNVVPLLEPLDEGERLRFAPGIPPDTILVRCRLMSGGIVVATGYGARSITKDFGDVNKALKMAEKSAHIDATLRLAGLSEVFTQDIEDMAIGEAEAPATAKDSSQPSEGPDEGRSPLFGAERTTAEREGSVGDGAPERGPEGPEWTDEMRSAQLHDQRWTGQDEPEACACGSPVGIFKGEKREKDGSKRETNWRQCHYARAYFLVFKENAEAPEPHVFESLRKKDAA